MCGKSIVQQFFQGSLLDVSFHAPILEIMENMS